MNITNKNEVTCRGSYVLGTACGKCVKCKTELAELAAYGIATAQQSKPTGSGPDIVDMVKADLEARAVLGEKTYGQRLKANNGRDALVDAYQEALDLVMYLRQAIEEKARLGY